MYGVSRRLMVWLVSIGHGRPLAGSFEPLPRYRENIRRVFLSRDDLRDFISFLPLRVSSVVNGNRTAREVYVKRVRHWITKHSKEAGNSKNNSREIMGQLFADQFFVDTPQRNFVLRSD